MPELSDVVPAPGGENGEVTTDQAYAYMDAVDQASDRVITGALDQPSQQGRELRWAIVGHGDRLDRKSLNAIAKAAQALRNPKTPPGLARAIAKRFPAILWIASNVHGGEESGTDASMRVLYELADRTDCAARQILDNSLVVLLPIQNPDGRELNTRQNYYGFDMNRDWFARTQPETDSKIELLRRFPGPLFVDDHEMGADDFFFPPNADPIYHEIADEPVDWINNIYGASLAAEFNRQGIPFFNRDLYDLFYMGYGDTVPATGFNSAGMTYEKNNADPIADRAYEQYVTQWVTLSQGAIRKREILEEWASAWREGYRQGVAGFLEPNELVNETDSEGNPQELVSQVPDMKVRHYFVTEGRASKQREVQAMIRRLQRMDVDVYRLKRGLWVPDYTPYGRRTRAQWMPPGTWYVPMAQMQKHWVQAMLNEDTYTPFPYFYDVTAWSQPLLFNVRGGYSGRALKVRARGVGELDDPGGPAPPADAPRIAVFQLSDTTSAIESTGWLRYLMEKVWQLPYTPVSAADIAAGGLSGYDVVIMPNGFVPDAVAALGTPGADALRAFVNGGGHAIAWRGGAALAAQLGLTTALLSDPAPTNQVPGSLFRVRLDDDTPLRRGVGRQAYAFYEFDAVMRASNPDHVAVSYPPVSSNDWFISGYAEGAEELGGTAAVVDEPVGAGRATVFSVEPNFRAFTTGFQKILRNALLGADAAGARAARAGSSARARRAARRLEGTSSDLRLAVSAATAGGARDVLDRFGASYSASRKGATVGFVIANPRELSADDHPFARRLPAALARAGVSTLAFRAP